MNVKQVMIETKMARAGMTVREVFAECARANTPALPFSDASGQINGRVTLKNILKRSCLPDYVVETARVLGEQLSHMRDMCSDARELLEQPIDDFVQPPHLALSSDSTAIKALAMMEMADTSYIFVIDEGRYQGVVTIHRLADTLADIDAQPN